MKTFTKLALAALMLASTMAAQVKGARAAEQKQPAYVASAIREPFHKPSCEWAQKIADKNLQTFQTKDEAIKAGHRPCKVCKP